MNKTLIIATIFAGSLFAQDAPKTPKEPVKKESVEDLKKTIEEKDQKIAILNELVNQLTIKVEAAIKFYTSNQAAIDLEALRKKQ